MSDILATLRAAHDNQEMVKVKVPEYGATWYFPPLTVADHQDIRRGVARGDEHQLMLNGLVRMAHDESGARVFDVPVAQKPALLAELNKMDFAVLRRVLQQSGGGLPDAVLSEIGAIDPEALRAALASVLADQPELSEALSSAKTEALQDALARMAEALVPPLSAKNV